MSKKLILILLSVLAVVIIGFIVLPKLISTNKNSGDNRRQNPSQQNQPIAVDVFIIKEQILDNEIKAIGTIRANEEAEIMSEVSRKIRSIYFREGTYVTKGKVLFRMDADDLVAKLRKQEIEEELAVSRVTREKQLIEKGLISQEEFDVTENTLEKIRADISITRIDISKTTIHAPFSGIIGLRNVSAGAYVTPGVTLTTMQDISKVKIDFSIPEKYIYFFQKGGKISFKVDGIDGDFEAEVYAYEPKIENNTRSLVLRAVCTNKDRKLLPGTFANVTFKISEDKSAILVPTQSIVPKLKGQSIYVIRNSKAILIDVEIGERSEQFVQITSGNINSSDTVITTNILRLKNEAPVKVNNSGQ